MNAEPKKSLVLIIEDDASLQKILQAKLLEQGIDVINAGSAAEAFPLVKSRTPNLILVDVMLPGGLNGFDILEQFKRDGTLRKTPVIVLTNLEGEEKTALAIGAVAYIEKTTLPIDQIVVKIKSFLK
jgi:two-component system phosphate regulon response regulator PhoB